MNIGVDTRSLMDKNYSGVSEYTFNLLTEILKLDQSNNYKLFYNSFHDIAERMPKFETGYSENVKLNYPNKVLNYFYFKLLNRPKIDKLCGAGLFFMPHVNLISLSDECRKILTIHDLSYIRHPEFFSARKNFWHYFINIKKFAQGFDTIIAVSENTKRDIISLLGIDEKKIKVIYSGLDKQFRQIDRESPEVIEYKRQFNLPDKFILSLGTLEPRKNIEGIIAAFEMIKSNKSDFSDLKLILVGGKGWKFNNIIKSWSGSRFKNDIIFLGYLPKYAKPYVYNLAAAFIYPSFYEGFGFPPLEAMASGTPVITSAATSLPEIAGQAAILVDPYNISQMSAAIERVLLDENLKNNLIKHGIDQAKKFSWTSAARQYLQVFDIEINKK
jgi:glycosyltransferase involved in cell wall biosynthesis